MIVYEDLLTGDELLSDSFPYREIGNGMLWEVDGKGVDHGAIDVDIGANPSARWWLSEGTPLKPSGYGENWHGPKMFALVAPQSLSPGGGRSSSTGTSVPPLWLDSGASIHMVGDAKILTNLRDPPTKMALSFPSQRLVSYRHQTSTFQMCTLPLGLK